MESKFLGKQASLNVMNSIQKIILLLVAITLVGMMVYPPFQVIGARGVVHNAGYALINSPPTGFLIRPSINVGLLLIQFIVVIVVGGVALALAGSGVKSSLPTVSAASDIGKNVSDAKPPISSGLTNRAPKAKAEPSGVGGWLLVLIAGLIMVGPLFALGQWSASIILIEVAEPALMTDEAWASYKSLSGFLLGVTIIVCLFGGWGLIKQRARAVIFRTIVILWVIGPISWVIRGLIVPRLVFGEVDVLSSDFLTHFFYSAFSALVWTAYLAKSKRVWNTYVE